MKQPLTEKLLLLIAELADFGYRIRSFEGAFSIPGDPRFNKYLRAMNKYLENKEGRRKLKSAYNALKRRNFLQKQIFNNKVGYVLSNKGFEKLIKIRTKLPRNAKMAKLPKGQFIMIFFDIPEKIRNKRNLLRFGLRNLGFEQVQKSVWVTSINVSKEIKKFIEEIGLESYAKILKVKEY